MFFLSGLNFLVEFSSKPLNALILLVRQFLGGRLVLYHCMFEIRPLFPRSRLQKLWEFYMFSRGQFGTPRERVWRTACALCNTLVYFSSNKIATVNRRKDFQTSYPPKNTGIRGIFVSKVSANEKRGGLKLVAFDRFPFMLVSLRFSKKSM